jgi:hypothetical protein
MDTNQLQAEHFVYRLNLQIRAMVRMWKPSSVVEAVESTCYIEENTSLNKGMRSTIPQQSGFMEKAPRTFSRGGSSKKPPYGNRTTPRVVATCI